MHRSRSDYKTKRPELSTINGSRPLSTSPAFDYLLRAKHDTAMFRWARGQGQKEEPGHRPILIGGHTHHPVFPGSPAPPVDPGDIEAVRGQLEEARAAAATRDEIAAIRARLESLRAIPRYHRYSIPAVDEPPCYFNGGCACYPDGDVTCLELDGAANEIRLARWPRNTEGRPPVLPSLPLTVTLQKVQAATGN